MPDSACEARLRELSCLVPAAPSESDMQMQLNLDLVVMV